MTLLNSPSPTEAKHILSSSQPELGDTTRRGILATSGNLFWLSQEGECYRHSIGRDQRGRQTSRNAQDSPTAIIQPKMPLQR